MGQRKLIGFGKNSFIVTLPKLWVEKNKLKKGDVLNVDEVSGALQISLISSTPSEEIILTKNINEKNKSEKIIQMEIVSGYLANANIIRIFSDTHLRHATDYKETILNLPGFEIIESTKNTIVAKDVLNEDAVSVSQTVQRIHRITRTILVDSVAVKKQEEVDELHSRDKDLNRLVFLLFRILRYILANPATQRKHNITALMVLRYWALGRRFEHLGDYSKRFSKYILNSKISSQNMKSIKKIHKELVDLFDRVVSMLNADDLSPYYSMEVKISDLIAKIKDFLLFLPQGGDSLAVISLNEMVTIIRHMFRTILNAEDLLVEEENI